MMGTMIAVGWLNIAIVTLFLAGGMVALARLLNPDAELAQQGRAGILRLVLAALGILAVVVLIAAIAIDWSMRAMMG